MTVKDIYNYIDSFAPFTSQAQWDNSGLLSGSMAEEVTSVFVCLDVTHDVISEAADKGAQIIVSHHPVIFSPLSHIDSESVVYKLISNGISVICAHTNLDIADGGVNDTLCEKLGLTGEKTESEPFLKLCTAEKSYDNAASFAHYCAAALNTEATVSLPEKSVDKVAVCSGAGGSFVIPAIDCGADILLTGEVKYHDYIDASQLGLSIISLGHYETEYPIVPVLQRKLSEAFPKINVFRSEFKRQTVTVK